MSVAVPTPPSLATRPTMLPKSSAPRIQSRPSTSSSSAGAGASSRPMAPRPPARPVLNATPSGSAPRVAARPALPSSVSASASTSARPSPAPRANSSASASTSAAGPALSSKDTSSSAGKIFAKPSKEWVLPERAKPGRKVSVDEPDNKRQSQNRLSQRAHRARRTDYIQTLEERLRQYEADEIHSNVRLQEVARALKADNERLKAEVASLKNTCLEYNGEKDVWEMERRAMKEAVREMRMEVEALRAGRGMETTIVRMDVDQGTIDSLVPGPSIPRRQSTTSHLPAINSSRQPGHALQDCPICPNPDPDCPCQQAHTPQSYLPEHLTLAPAAPAEEPSHDACGFCRSTDECLCRAVEQEDIKPDISSPGPGGMALDGCGLCEGGGFCACKEAAALSNSNSPSVPSGSKLVPSGAATGIFRASTSTAALPLRLRTKTAGVAKPSIWALSTATGPESPAAKAEAQCTGDPSNCDACKNDTFGQEFCGHLFESTNTEAHPQPCTTCPGECMGIKNLLSPSPGITQASSASTLIRTPPTPPPAPAPSAMTRLDDGVDDTPFAPLQMACCGNPELCGGGGCTGDVIGIGGPSGSQDAMTAIGGMQSTGHAGHAHAHDDHEDAEDDHTTLRPDQAWKTLKAHPNAKFASLALLADVVARRTKCLGPRVELSPMPGSPAPPHASTPGPSHSHSPHFSPSHAHPHAHAHAHPHVHLHKGTASPSAGAGSSPLSASQAASLKKRNLEVETSALRNALKLLDEATPAPSPEPERELKKRKVDF
ncbi:hypothetical protein IAT38_005349 [Cryptococcus sp. DSM 104549]